MLKCQYIPAVKLKLVALLIKRGHKPLKAELFTSYFKFIIAEFNKQQFFFDKHQNKASSFINGSVYVQEKSDSRHVKRAIAVIINGHILIQKTSCITIHSKMDFFAFLIKMLVVHTNIFEKTIVQNISFPHMNEST
jgi:hypothetical protein